MKILSMTASFGKLNGSLALEDGLNVITAPNESGKSTWCAFLLAMLYGIDVSQRKSKANVLPEKTRYAPWSGLPLEGTMEIEWQGRRITLERTSSPRVPMGILKVYDTQTGQPIPELTADNCGQVLLGVERSVFERTAFLRQSGISLSPDSHLEQRLNALITTGDDSSNATDILKRLREMQNSLTGRSGKIRSVESEMQEINHTLIEGESIQAEMAEMQARADQLQAALARDEALLQRHEQAEQFGRWVAYQESEQELVRCQQALEAAEADAVDLPPEELYAELLALNNITPPKAEPEPVNHPIKMPSLWPVILAAIVTLVSFPVMAASVATGLTILGIGIGADALAYFWYKTRRENVEMQRQNRKREADHEQLTRLRAYEQAEEAFWCKMDLYKYCDTLAEAKAVLEQGELIRQRLQLASDGLRAAQARLDSMGDVEPVAFAAPPRQPKAEVLQQLEAHRTEWNGLNNRIALLQGRMEATCDPDALHARREQLQLQLRALNRRANQIAMAEEHLRKANAELQARFAPQIAEKAGPILNRLTDGRYAKLLLRQDMSVDTATTDSPILRPSAALSCGTVDQLYLSVRLAMAQLLLGEDVPLILDDALVNFDDHRAKIALELLNQLAEQRQVILFTCHDREKAMLS